MNNKGQLIAINAGLTLLIGLIFALILLVALWPVAGNFLELASSVPNYSTVKTLADIIPILLIFGVIVSGIMAIQGRNQGYQ